MNTLFEGLRTSRLWIIRSVFLLWFLTSLQILQSDAADVPGCVALPAGLITWLPGEDHSLDRLGNHSAQLTGGTGFAPGLVGRAFSFDGVDDAVDIGAWFDLQTFSISLWVNEGETQGDSSDILDCNHTGFRGFVLQNYAQPIHEYSFGIAGTGLIGTIALRPGVWQHLVLSRDATGAARIHLDGQLVGEVSGGSVVYDGAQFLRLGRWGGGGRHWHGAMDEVDIYNRALSAAEVQALFNAGVAGKCLPCIPPEPSLLGWWPADGTPANAACGAPAVPQGGATYASGKSKQSFSFDGADDSVDLGAGYQLQTFTYAFWVKEGETQGSGFIDILDTDHRSEVGIVIQKGHDGPHDYVVGMGGTEGMFVTLQPGVWQHIAFTRGEDGLAQLFLDGQRIDTKSSPPVVYHGSEFLRLGRWGGGGRHWRGEIDEFRVYNRALSPAEVGLLVRGDGGPGGCVPAPTGLVGWWSGEGSSLDAVSLQNS